MKARALTMDAWEQDRPTRAVQHGAAADDRLPMCYFCSSTDTMAPFVRPDRVLLISTLFPRVRLRYCRSCTRHFLAVLPRPDR